MWLRSLNPLDVPHTENQWQNSETEVFFLFKESKAQESSSELYLNPGLEGTIYPLIFNYRDSLRLPSVVGLLLSGSSTRVLCTAESE